MMNSERWIIMTIIKETMPAGPVNRTIEYIVFFDCCDHEQDYKTAWKFFEEKYDNNITH